MQERARHQTSKHMHFTPLMAHEGKNRVLGERIKGMVSNLECGTSKDLKDEPSKGKGKMFCKQREQCANAQRQRDARVVGAE